MIRRAIDARFVDPVLEGRKITTIRDSAWPVEVPIMLFRWQGKPYRSKQVDVAEICVKHVLPIHITHKAGCKQLSFVYRSYLHGRWLWCHEGFNNQAELDDWFRPLVPEGTTVTKSMMWFAVRNGKAQV